MSQQWVKFLPAPLRSRLSGRPYLQQVVGNTAWLVGDRVARLGVGLLVGVWVARYLGPTDFGLFSYAIAFASMFAAISTLGLEAILTRELVAEGCPEGELMGSAFLMRLAGATTAFLLAAATILVVRPGDPLTQAMVAIVAAGNFFQAFDVIESGFQARVMSKFTVMAKGAAFFVLSGVKVALILLHAPLMSFAIASTAEVALGAAGLVVAYRAAHHSIRSWRPNLRWMWSLFRDVWPYTLANLVILLYMRIDQVMLGQMAGNRDLGIYSAAVRLAESWYFIPTAIVSSVFPSIVNSMARGDDTFYGRLQRLYRVIALVSYLVAVPTTFLAPWIVAVVYGPDYAAAAPILVTLIWAGLFTSLGVARGSFMTTMNWTRLHLLTVSLGCLINIALNVVLIPRYGGLGAAIASLIAYGFAAVGSCFLFKPLWRTGWMLVKAVASPRL